jgi:phosphoglycolate phosphatase
VSLNFRPQLLVFDLDGTLVDSQVDLTNSVNAMLEHYGKRSLDGAVVASYIGDGAGTLVRRALAHEHLIADEADPNDDVFINEALDWFIAYYKVHKLDYTYVYPGVLESLEAIRRAHPRLPMAVLTNKPVNPSRAICRHFGMDRFFFANYGGNSFQTKKPDPEGLLKLIAEAEVRPRETVMIGDSHVDVETARNGGAAAVGCVYGLSPESLRAARPDVLVESAADWGRVLNLG